MVPTPVLVSVNGPVSLTLCTQVVELDHTDDKDGYAMALVELTGQKTVPNIFIGGKSIGGADDTFNLHNEGKLCPLLVQVGVPASNCVL